MKKLCFFMFLLLVINCHNLFAQTQAELNETAMNDYNKSDVELNKYYKELTKILSEKSKQKLVMTQRLWIKYRDSHCDFEASYFDGGTIRPVIKFTCLKNITDQRIDNLKQSIKMRDN